MVITRASTSKGKVVLLLEPQSVGEVGDTLELGVMDEQEWQHLLEDELGRLLARLDNTSPSCILLGTLGSPITVGATLPAQGLSMGFQTLNSSLLPFMTPMRFAVALVFASAAISVVKKMNFERFFRLKPLRLFNMGTLDEHGVSSNFYTFLGKPIYLI
ncbi:hypothetical protein R3W88_016722 [Solanum pinnatisectum]|uniref:Uncharacterized protein n=1 Tax=Solanum pinnatisectum TaxID=50273 RepID=A0AAV9L0M9_9SOLN|nr:hypothetical protein R3W88_016722 [Solanum pinnatisectum]